MKQYEKYKDSGIAWIGEIPEHWKLCKTLFTLSMPITDGPHETPEFYEKGILFISAESIKNGNISFALKRGYISKEYYDLCCKKYTPMIGDIYMIKSGATTGNIAIVNTTEIFQIWSPLAVFRVNSSFASKFMYYYLQSSCYQKQVQLNWSYGTQQNIGMRVLEKLITVFPPFIEQQEIADHLDRKCLEIDELVSLQEQMIKELQAYKQSVITETVTKGLDKNAPLKDSGIEWIGEIPEHWEVAKLKCISSKIGDGLHGTPEFHIEGKYYFVNGNNLGGRYLELKSTTQKINKTEYDKYKKELNNNSVLVSLNGTIGNISMYNNEPIILSKSAGYINLKQFCRLYFYYQLKSENILRQWLLTLSGTTIPNLSLNALNNTNVVLPSIAEQQAIADHLDKKCNEIDQLIDIKKQKIVELKEYKKSIIFEYVTGKKKVN